MLNWLGLALAASAIFRALLLWMGTVPFNSDEAIVGLMARHILRGAQPVFFYGQAYMGSLDAYLVAGAFQLLGESVLSIRVVQIGLYLLTMLSIWWLARAWFPEPRVAALAVMLAAIPPVVVTTYTTVSLGGYGETLLFGNLILGLGWAVTCGGRERSRTHWLALGVVSGLAFWTLGLALVYLLPVAALGLMRPRRLHWPSIALAGLAFLLASSPWWLDNIAHAWAALRTLLGMQDPKSNLAWPTLSLGERGLGFALLGVPALLGLRPPWSPEFYPWPVLLAALLVYLAVAAYHALNLRRGVNDMAPGSRRLLGLFVLCFAALFMITHLGRDATGRYFLPLFVVVILATASAINALWERRRALGALAMMLVLGVNAFGNGQAARSPEGLTTQFDPRTRFDNQSDAQLIDFLNAHGLTRGYSHYWVTFRLAFLSGERLVYSAALPYKPDFYDPGDNRYPPHAQAADESATAAYITTAQQTDLESRLRSELARLGVTYTEAQIGPYRVFYEFSRKVMPNEMELLPTNR